MKVAIGTPRQKLYLAAVLSIHSENSAFEKQSHAIREKFTGNVGFRGTCGETSDGRLLMNDECRISDYLENA